MKKKVEFDLFFGYVLLIFGACSVGYVVVAFIINVVSLQTGFFLIIRDISFDLVLILLGLLIVRKKKTQNHHVQ